MKNSATVMSGAVILCLVQAAMPATVPIAFDAFGAARKFESFEGLEFGPNVAMSVLQTPDSLVPGSTSAFQFASGITIVSPIPNREDYYVFDFSRRIDPRAPYSTFGLGANGTIESVVDVPFGTAFIANDNILKSIDFKLPPLTNRVGAFVSAEFGFSITMSVFDSGGTLLGSNTVESTPVEVWGQNFVGLESTEVIDSVRFAGRFMVIDGLTFEAVPEPATIVLFVIAAAALVVTRWRR